MLLCSAFYIRTPSSLINAPLLFCLMPSAYLFDISGDENGLHWLVSLSSTGSLTSSIPLKVPFSILRWIVRQLFM